MGSATKLDRIGPAGLIAAQRRAHRHDAHFLAVFFAEKRHGPGRDRVVHGHQPRRHRRILQDDFIGHGFDFRELRIADGLGMRKVEAQPVWRDERTLLRNVRAQNTTHRLM